MAALYTIIRLIGYGGRCTIQPAEKTTEPAVSTWSIEKLSGKEAPLHFPLMCTFLVLSLASFIPVSSTLSASETALIKVPEYKVISEKNLDRRYDIVVVTGDMLPSLLQQEISHLRLYSFANGTFSSAVFQIDERDPQGEFVYTGGDLAGSDRDAGRLDENDELVFEAAALGSRVTRELWPQAASLGEEIEVSDPRDSAKKGWAYVLYFPHDPPAPLPEDYLSYDQVRDRVVGRFYTVGYKKGFTLFTDLIYPKEYGGSGEDFMDRLKVRIDVRLLGGLTHIRRTEQDMRCRVVGWKDGPVRVLRNTENTFRILFNIPSPSLFSVTEYYPHYFTVPMRFSVPFSLKWVMNSFLVSGFAVTVYGDFLSCMIGGRAYSNRNPQGIQFTGHTPYKELLKTYDMTNVIWGYFGKEGIGMWFPRVAFPEAVLQYFQIYLKDEANKKDPPEDEPGGVMCGSSAYSQSLHDTVGVPGGKGFTADFWDMIRAGTVELPVDTYIAPPGMKPAEIGEWLAIRDYPLVADVTSNSESRHGVVGETDPSLVKATILDRKGRRICLRDLFFHIGSSRSTGWDTVIGYEVDQDRWHSIPISEILRIDVRIVENDPKTGLTTPLYLKVTKRDGSTVDLLNAKTASFSGHINALESVCIWNHRIERIDLTHE